MPVPTIISAEDELREQKSNAEKYRTGELKSLAKRILRTAIHSSCKIR